MGGRHLALMVAAAAAAAAAFVAAAGAVAAVKTAPSSAPIAVAPGELLWDAMEARNLPLVAKFVEDIATSAARAADEDGGEGAAEGAEAARAGGTAAGGATVDPFAPLAALGQRSLIGVLAGDSTLPVHLRYLYLSAVLAAYGEDMREGPAALAQAVLLAVRQENYECVGPLVRRLGRPMGRGAPNAPGGRPLRFSSRSPAFKDFFESLKQLLRKQQYALFRDLFLVLRPPHKSLGKLLFDAVLWKAPKTTVEFLLACGANPLEFNDDDDDVDAVEEIEVSQNSNSLLIALARYPQNDEEERVLDVLVTAIEDVARDVHQGFVLPGLNIIHRRLYAGDGSPLMVRVLRIFANLGEGAMCCFRDSDGRNLVRAAIEGRALAPLLFLREVYARNPHFCGPDLQDRWGVMPSTRLFFGGRPLVASWVVMHRLFRWLLEPVPLMGGNAIYMSVYYRYEMPGILLSVGEAGAAAFGPSALQIVAEHADLSGHKPGPPVRESFAQHPRFRHRFLSALDSEDFPSLDEKLASMLIFEAPEKYEEAPKRALRFGNIPVPDPRAVIFENDLMTRVVFRDAPETVVLLVAKWLRGCRKSNSLCLSSLLRATAVAAGTYITHAPSTSAVHLMTANVRALEALASLDLAPGIFLTRSLAMWDMKDCAGVLSIFRVYGSWMSAADRRASIVHVTQSLLSLQSRLEDSEAARVLAAVLRAAPFDGADVAVALRTVAMTQVRFRRDVSDDFLCHVARAPSKYCLPRLLDYRNRSAYFSPVFRPNELAKMTLIPLIGVPRVAPDYMQLHRPLNVRKWGLWRRKLLLVSVLLDSPRWLATDAAIPPPPELARVHLIFYRGALLLFALTAGWAAYTVGVGGYADYLREFCHVVPARRRAGFPPPPFAGAEQRYANTVETVLFGQLGVRGGVRGAGAIFREVLVAPPGAGGALRRALRLHRLVPYLMRALRAACMLHLAVEWLVLAPLWWTSSEFPGFRVVGLHPSWSYLMFVLLVHIAWRPRLTEAEINWLWLFAGVKSPALDYERAFFWRLRSGRERAAAKGGDAARERPLGHPRAAPAARRRRQLRGPQSPRRRGSPATWDPPRAAEKHARQAGHLWRARQAERRVNLARLRKTFGEWGRRPLRRPVTGGAAAAPFPPPLPPWGSSESAVKLLHARHFERLLMDRALAALGRPRRAPLVLAQLAFALAMWAALLWPVRPFYPGVSVADRGVFVSESINWLYRTHPTLAGVRRLLVLGGSFFAILAATSPLVLAAVLAVRLREMAKALKKELVEGLGATHAAPAAVAGAVATPQAAMLNAGRGAPAAGKPAVPATAGAGAAAGAAAGVGGCPAPDPVAIGGVVGGVRLDSLMESYVDVRQTLLKQFSLTYAVVAPAVSAATAAAAAFVVATALRAQSAAPEGGSVRHTSAAQCLVFLALLLALLAVQVRANASLDAGWLPLRRSFSLDNVLRPDAPRERLTAQVVHFHAPREFRFSLFALPVSLHLTLLLAVIVAWQVAVRIFPTLIPRPPPEVLAALGEEAESVVH